MAARGDGRWPIVVIVRLSSNPLTGGKPPDCLKLEVQVADGAEADDLGHSEKGDRVVHFMPLMLHGRGQGERAGDRGRGREAGRHAIRRYPESGLFPSSSSRLCSTGSR